jgi:hypothetical protein
VRNRRVSFLSESVEYDPSDPEGYRSGQIHVTKALGARWRLGPLRSESRNHPSIRVWC